MYLRLAILSGELLSASWTRLGVFLLFTLVSSADSIFSLSSKDFSLTLTSACSPLNCLTSFSNTCLFDAFSEYQTSISVAAWANDTLKKEAAVPNTTVRQESGAPKN